MFHDLVQLNYATVIIIGFMLIFICTNQFFNRDITNLFVLASFCVLTLVLVDSVEYKLASLSRPVTARIWMSAVGYSLRPAIIYTIILLVTREERTKRLVMAIPLVLNMCVSFSALFTDIAFSYAEDNSFVRGPLGYAAFVTSGFYLVLLLVSTIRRYQNENTSEAFIAIAVLVMIVISVIMESFAGFDGVINVTGAVSITFYYLFLNTQQFKRDALTNTLNRRCFYLDAEKYRTILSAVLCIDLNNLKRINDGQGHEEGDKAICTMVSCIRRVLKKGCYLYRTGGDEFMILCVRQSEESVVSMIEDIKREMERTPYSCAVGMAYSEGTESLEKLCAKADETMYADKVRMKKEMAKGSGQA